MSAVIENVELTRAERHLKNGRNVITVRGELVPYVRLREHFACTGEDPATEKVVIVRHGPDRVGVVVDRVLGSHQTVIQSLGRFYRDIEVLSGATIMGDGRVALIIDLAGLVSFVGKESQTAPRSLPLNAARPGTHLRENLNYHEQQ
jgi:two-component system chemotaxis sensor kinase CheA